MRDHRKSKFKLDKKWREWATDGLIVTLVLGFFRAGPLLVFISPLDLPDLSAFEQRRILQSTKIYDRTGEVVLYDLNQDVKRTAEPYERISHHIKNATVAIEDDTFFQHHGVRPLSILRAMIYNVQGGDLRGQGGSTITQQVIKNALLSPEKAYIRKLKEVILALRLEQVMTKEEILHTYLNESPYGNHRDGLDQRQKRVLEQMEKLDFISEEEYQAAIAEEVKFSASANTGIRAPHFVMYIREKLVERYGEEDLATKGLKVITTLDYELQEEAEKIIKEYALQNETKYNASNAGMVAMDPKTGDILVMVGSRDYFDEAVDGNYNITLADRQPGSSIKPFIYAKAFEKGYTPATTLFDVRTQFSTACSPDNFTSDDGCYSPQNYDNAFRGPVSMRNALAQSLNIPAVKTLYLAGIPDSIKLARDAGLSTLTDWRRYGLTLVLGGGEVRLIDMVGAYSVLANEGVKKPTRDILRIEDMQGNVLEKVEDEEPEGSRVMDRDAARQISDILSDNVARTPLYGANSQLHFGDRDVAAKTGTTNDKRDAWIFGYTPNLVVGAWAGNNDNRSMNEISGLIISPLWRAFMDKALAKVENEIFAEPAAIPSDIKPVLRSNGYFVDTTSLLSELDGDTDAEGLLNAIYQNTHSILHYVNKDDTRGPYPNNPASDGQYNLWEYGVSVWKGGQFSNMVGSSTESIEDNNDRDEEGEPVGTRQN